MPDLTFATKGAAEVISAQEKLNKSAKEGADAYEDLEKSAKDAGKEIAQSSKKGAESQDKLTKEVKQTRAEYQKNLDEQRRLGRIAEQITKRNETAQERYNRLLREAKDAVKANLVTHEQYRREVGSLRKEMDAASGRFKSFVTQQEKSFGAAALASLKTYAAGVLSIAAAYRYVTAELRAQQDLTDRAQQQKLGVSETRNVLIRNLVGASPSQIQSVIGQNQSLAKQLGVSESVINLARADTLSATGGDIQASLNATQVGARFLKDQPGAIAQFAGSLTDLSKVTGTNDASVNLGLLTTVGGLSRVVNPQAQAQNIPRSLIGQLSFGSTPQEAAALFAAITTASADIQGATSGTGSVSLAEQLSRFEPFGGKGTTGERIRALQQNRALAEQFLGDASFEKTVLGPIRQLLLDPTSDAARAFASNLSQIPDTAGLRRRGEQSLASLSVNDLNRTVDRRTAILSTAERIATRGGTGPLASDEIQAIQDTINRRTKSSVLTSFRFALDAGGGISVDDAIGQLQGVINRQEAAIEYARRNRGGQLQITEEELRAREKETRESSQGIQEMIDVLKSIQQQGQETNRLLEDSGLVGVAG